VGFFVADSIYVTVSDCQSYTNATGASNDAGGGFDIDLGSFNCLVMNCLAYSNSAAGYAINGNVLGNVTTNGNCSFVNCVGINNGVGGGTTTPCELDITAVTSGSVTNLRVSGCSFYGSATDLVEIKGTQSATVAGLVTNNRFTAPGSQKFITAATNPSGLVFNGNQYSGPGGFSVTWNNVSYPSMGAWIAAFPQQEENNNMISYAVAATITQTAPGGTFPGTYIAIDGDTKNRLAAAVDGGNRPYVGYGPGGSTSQDTFLNRQAAGVLGVGTNTSNTSGTLAASALQTTTASVGTAGGSTTPAFVVNSVGGAGQPTTANQNGWLKMVDSTGATIWIPQWK
jgi:hypothetical protein